MTDLYDKIEAYFEGTLTGSEQKEFERLLKEDSDFAQSVEAFQMVRAHFTDRFEKEKAAEPLKETLAKFNDKFFKDSEAEISNAAAPVLVSIRKKIWWAVAAIAATIVLLVALNRGSKEQNLYAEFARLPQAAFVEKGEQENTLAAAEKYFNEKNYSKALIEINRALEVLPESSELLFYKGLCLLELENLPGARLIFESLKQGNSAYREDALWFLALSYLRSEELQKAREQLQQIPPDGSHFSEAQELIDRLYRL